MKKIIFKTVAGAYQLYFRGLYKLNPQKAAAKAVKLFSKPRIRKFRPQEMAVLDKAWVTDMDYEGIKIKTYLWEGGHKKALLVHGWEGHAGHLGAFVEPLQKEGFSVIAFDGPAHGRSQGKYTNLVHFGNLINRLITKFDINVIITHSFGSASTAYALNITRHPVDKLVMITSPDKMEDIINEYGDVMNFDKPLREEIFNYIQKVLGRNPKEVKISELAQQIKTGEIMLVHSPDDRILSYRNTERIYKNLSNARLLAPENKGHYRILWDEEVIKEVVEFIKNR